VHDDFHMFRNKTLDSFLKEEITAEEAAKLIHNKA